MMHEEQEVLVQNIRAQYTEKQPTELDELKKLDAKVKRPANILAYALGSVSAMVMGAGMSLIMTDLGSSIGMKKTMGPGVGVGIVGMAMALANYPIYKKVLRSRKEKYASEILALSDEILNK